MNIREHLDALAVAIAAVVGALGTAIYRWLRGRSEYVSSRGQAHGAHAEAEIKEAQARLTLDDATREWAQALIDRYDHENEQLREEIAAARDEFRRERARWESRVAELSAEIEVLRKRIAELVAENTLLKYGIANSCGFKTDDNASSHSR